MDFRIRDLRRSDLLILALFLIPCWVIAANYEVDFRTIYRTAVSAHTNIHGVYLEEPGVGRFFYGPISVVLLKPFGSFSFEFVKWCWIGIQTISYVIFYWMLYALFPILRQSKLAFFLVWLFSINPVHNNFQSNNIQLMLAALLVLGEYLTLTSSRFKQMTGGALCVLAAAIKVFPAFIVCWYLVAKPRKVRWGLVVGLLLSGLIPFATYGFEGGTFLYQEFFRNLTTYEADNSLTKIPDILCLPSLIARWAEGLPLSSTAASWLTRLAIVGCSGLFFVFGWLNRKRIQPQYLWSLALLLMTLLNPSTRVHYFIFYVPAICSVFELTYSSESKRKFGWVVISISTILIAFTTESILGKQLNDRFEFLSIPTLGAVFLAIGFSRLLMTTERSSAPVPKPTGQSAGILSASPIPSE